jgi:hypothetical protein
MTKYGPHNPHPLSTMRTELVWEGKYDEFGDRPRPRAVRSRMRRRSSFAATPRMADDLGKVGRGIEERFGQ